jgi:hypothetical protein
LTPETFDVYNTLIEHAEQVKDGKWRLEPRIQKRMKEHDKIVEYLCELGQKAGYEVWGYTEKKKEIEF